MILIVHNPAIDAKEMDPMLGRMDRTAPVASGIATSLLLHGALIIAVFVGSIYSDRVVEEELGYDIVFDQVELLQLGEEKPKAELPRIPNPAPAAPAQPVVDNSKPKEMPAEPVVDTQAVKEQERQRREDQAKVEHDTRQKKMQDALSALHNPNRPVNTDTPAGSADGIAGGTVSDAAMANLMGTYQAKLLAEFSRYWEIPSTITAQEKSSLAGQVHVYVRLSDSGHIVSYSFRKLSSNEQFNASIERVLKRFQVQFGGRALPMPDNPQVRQAVVMRGLELKNWEDVNR